MGDPTTVTFAEFEARRKELRLAELEARVAELEKRLLMVASSASYGDGLRQAYPEGHAKHVASTVQIVALAGCVLVVLGLLSIAAKQLGWFP